MKQQSLPDPFLIQHLLSIAELFKSNPDHQITGSAIKGLRLLLTLTAQCLTCIEAAFSSNPDLPPDALPAGLPTTISDAEAQHHRASQLILDVLRIRLTQREAQRDAGGKIFTSADYDAIRLWCLANQALNPLPADLQTTINPPSTKRKPSQPPSIPSESALEQMLEASTLPEPLITTRSSPTTRTVRRKNGRTITKQLRQRAKVAC